MNIYELPKEINEALEKYYSCFDQDTWELITTEEEMKLAETRMFELQNRKEELLEWYLKDRANRIAHNEWISQEIKRLQDIQKRNNKNIERVEKIIDFNIENKEKKTTLWNFIVSYRKSKSTVIEDESKIPEDYIVREMIESVKIPKDPIKNAIESGEEVPWAYISNNIKLVIK